MDAGDNAVGLFFPFSMQWGGCTKGGESSLFPGMTSSRPGAVMAAKSVDIDRWAGAT